MQHVTDDGRVKERDTDQQILQTLINSSIANSTWKKYQSSWSRWTDYATRHRMSVLPASPDDVALFFAHLVKSGHKSVCASASAAIAWYHTSGGHPSPSNSPLVKTVLAGAKRCLASPIRRMEPISLSLLKSLVAGSCNCLEDWQFVFYCIIAFFGFFRYNDMCMLLVSDFTFQCDSVLISIDHSKTDQYRAGSKVVLAASFHDLSICPVVISRAYFSQLINAGLTNSVHVMIDPASKSKLTSHGTLLSKLRQSLKPFVANPEMYGLHSFRSGGATAATNANVPKDLIAVHGRWQSDCVNRYIKHNHASRLTVSQAMSNIH